MIRRTDAELFPLAAESTAVTPAPRDDHATTPRDDHATTPRDDHATTPRDDHATTPPPDDAPERNYRRGALAVVPFLFVGLADVALVVAYGVDPVWGLAIVPPIAFICALAWIAFSTEFLEDRTGHGTETHGSDRQ